MTWTKTKDKLPKEGQKVIYYFKWVGVHRGEFTKFKIGPLPELDCFRSKIGWLCGDVPIGCLMKGKNYQKHRRRENESNRTNQNVAGKNRKTW